MYCIKCGAEIDGDSKFCKSCGAEIAKEPTISQPEAVEQLTAEEQKQSITREADITSQGQNMTRQESEDVAVKPKKKHKGIVIAAVVSVAVITIAGIFAYSFMNGKGKRSNYEKHPIVYTKGDYAYLRDYDKDGPFRLSGSKHYYNNNGELKKDSFLKVSDDGKTVFFVDDDNNLYYKKASDGEAVLIGKATENNQVTADSKTVIYQQDGDLYSYNIDKGEGRLLAEAVYRFSLSNDSKKVTYMQKGKDDDLYDLYICGLDENDKPEKVDAGISDVVHGFKDTPEFVTGKYIKSFYMDYHNLCYYKDDKLYYKEYGKDSKEIDDLRGGTIFATESAVYFLGEGTPMRLRIKDIFYDDCDKSETEDKYGAEKTRETIRALSGEEFIEYKNTWSLYKVENGEWVKIFDDFIYASRWDATHGALFVKAKNIKIPLSAIDRYIYLGAGSDPINELYSAYGKYCDLQFFTILSDGRLLEVENIAPSAYNFQISEDEKYLYCIEDFRPHEENGTLNRYEISDSGLKNRTKIKDDTDHHYRPYSEYIDGGSWGYYNGRIFEDVRRFVGLDGAAYYFGKFDVDSEKGDLMRYKNGKTELIDTDVYEFKAKSGNVCYYIKNYDEKDGGDLYKLDGKKSEKIDSEVKDIIY